MTVLEKKDKIAIHIQSEVQFFSLLPLLNYFMESGANYVIVVDDFSGQKTGYKEMADGVVRLIKNAGFNVAPLQKYANEVFDVYLTTYVDGIIKSRCFLKYEYGTLNIKPSLTYTPDVLDKFHGFLCQSTVTHELLKTYGATYPVDNLRFFKKKRALKKRRKKTVLFAPTYNDDYDDAELAQIIRRLKEKYYVIVKGHHITNYLKENDKKKNILLSEADEYYGSEVCLSELILRVDVCLFGNSSAIGEAMYAGVPCAIMAKDLDSFKIGNTHTTQYLLVEQGILPYSKNIKDVIKILDEALTNKYQRAQKKCAKELFPTSFRTGVDGYVNVIEYYLKDPLAREYCELHDAILEERDKKNKTIGQLKRELAKKDELLEDFSRRKLYRMADKIYNLERKFINGKN